MKLRKQKEQRQVESHNGAWTCPTPFYMYRYHVCMADDQTVAFRTPAKLWIRLGQWNRFKIRIQASINGHSTENNNKTWFFKEILKRVSVSRSLFNRIQQHYPRQIFFFQRVTYLAPTVLLKYWLGWLKVFQIFILGVRGQKKSRELSGYKKCGVKRNHEICR
jgi:hypothetical protein